MESLVSVIVPIYNVEKYLDRCVESIVKQTYRNIEVILVDDGSADRCPQKCDEWAKKDARIRVIHQTNAGNGMAKNAGLEVMNGTYLMFVDSDDYISEDAVEVMLKRMISDDSDMAFGKHTDVYDDGHLDGRYCQWMEDAVLSGEEVFVRAGKERYYPVAPWAKLYRKEVFDGIRYPALKCAEDLWIFPMLIDHCRRISVVDQVIYFYYQRSNSIVHEKTIGRGMDELNSTLHFAHFLFRKGFKDSAGRWIRLAMDRAFKLGSSNAAIDIIRRYFSASESREILRRTDIKTNLKWIILNVPFLYTLIRRLKKS